MESVQLLAAVPQDRPTSPQAAADSAASFLDSLSAIEWIDWTAIVLLSVFFLLGLFKGFVWQISRILTLVGAWFLAGRYGPEGEQLLDRWLGAGVSDPNLHLFLAYVVIFVLAVVVFSLVAWLIQKLVRETGMTVYDRLGGAVLGLGTGGLGVIVILAGLYMFMPKDFGLVQAAQRSHSMQLSQRALQLLGDTVPEPMQHVFGLGAADQQQPPGPDPQRPGQQPDRPPRDK